jgi:hypothetical protein
MSGISRAGSADEIGELYNRAEQYREYAHYARRTHYRLSDRRARAHQWIGALTIVAAALVSTGFLSTINSSPSNAFKLAGGIIALVAAILSGFQTFYKFAEVGEQHRLAAANYGAVRRDLDLFLARYARQREDESPLAYAELDRLANAIDELDREGPGYPGRTYDGVKAKRQRELAKPS